MFPFCGIQDAAFWRFPSLVSPFVGLPETRQRFPLDSSHRPKGRAKTRVHVLGGAAAEPPHPDPPEPACTDVAWDGL